MDTGLMQRSSAATFFERMMADRERMHGFREAIRAQIRPGHIVVDLGCGAGLLSMFAAEAGAAHVIAVEPCAEAAALAREIIADNDYDGIIEVVEGDPSAFDPGMKVDAVICGLIGNFGTDAGIERILGGFCSRHLKPDGVAIPRRISTYLAPVCFEDEATGLWWEDSYGFNLTAGNRYIGWPDARFINPVRPWVTLAPPTRVEHLQFNAYGLDRAAARPARFELPDPARLEGFLGWFEADLSRGNRLSNRLHRPDNSWPLWFWPVAPGIALEAGDRLTARILDMDQPENAAIWQLDWRMDA